MSSISYKGVISALSFCFSVRGTPEEIIFDNGTQFTSKEYKKVGDKWGFTMTTSSPHYPRGHGFIEKQVQIINKFFNGCYEDNTNHQVALQELRATPLDRTHHPQWTFFIPDRWKKLPAIIKPPHNEAVRASLQSRQDFSRCDAQAKERTTLLPTLPNQCGYKTPLSTDGVKVWLSP